MEDSFKISFQGVMQDESSSKSPWPSSSVHNINDSSLVSITFYSMPIKSFQIDILFFKILFIDF